MTQLLLRIFGATVGLGALLSSVLELTLGSGQRGGLDTVNIVLFFLLGTVFLVYGLVGRTRLGRMGAQLKGESTAKGDQCED